MAVHTVQLNPQKKLPKYCQQIMHGSTIERHGAIKQRVPIRNQCPLAPVGWRDGMAFCKSHLHATYGKKSARYAAAEY